MSPRLPTTWASSPSFIFRSSSRKRMGCRRNHTGLLIDRVLQHSFRTPNSPGSAQVPDLPSHHAKVSHRSAYSLSHYMNWTAKRGRPSFDPPHTPLIQV